MFREYVCIKEHDILKFKMNSNALHLNCALVISFIFFFSVGRLKTPLMHFVEHL